MLKLNCSTGSLTSGRPIYCVIHNRMVFTSYAANVRGRVLQRLRAGPAWTGLQLCRSSAELATEQASTSTAAQPDDDWLQRSRLLVGDSGLARLEAANVLVVGLGGVGGFCAEFLCRAGIGAMTIVDGDEVDPTNRNRQLLALRSTQSMPKSRVLAERLLDINPALNLTEVQVCDLQSSTNP